MKINIKDLDKIKVLQALFANAKPAGMGYFSFGSSGGNNELGYEEAQQIYKENNGYFDYVKGKPLKISLNGDEIDTRDYNMVQGKGAAQAAINRLKLEDATLEPQGQLEDWQQALQQLGQKSANGQFGTEEAQHLQQIMATHAQICISAELPEETHSTGSSASAGTKDKASGPVPAPEASTEPAAQRPRNKCRMQ